MAPRKRTRQEAALEDVKEPSPAPVQHIEPPSLLLRIRNMSEFASFMQYIYLFGDAMKVPKMSIEDYEQECILPTPSVRLAEIGLALLKNISSNRTLTLDSFDEYTRRQYTAKAPEKDNPFGEEDDVKKFMDFDVFSKIRVLLQLSIWTFWNPDRMREKFVDMSQDEQQVEWRMEPVGWDSQERIYYVLDDLRLYRQTDPPIPEPERKKAKPKKRGSRASTRRVSRVVESTPEDDTDAMELDGEDDARGLEFEENFEGRKWECLAVTLQEYNDFIDGIRKSRDPDERALCRFLQEQTLPYLVEQEEQRQKEELRRLKELENIQKLASAKRSSRLANKQEAKREQDEADAAEQKRLEDLAMAHREQHRQRKLEEDRESRMMTREQRLKDREVKRILHEEALRTEQEQLEQLAKDEADGTANAGRISQRQLKADMEKRQKELEQLQSQEDEWMFDCSVCGVHGLNLDDGTHSIACDKCNVWQHSACHGIVQEQAEKEDFNFICKDCKTKAENPVPPIKLSLGATDQPSQPIVAPKPEKKKVGRPRKNTLPAHVKVVKKNGSSPKAAKPTTNGSIKQTNGQSKQSPITNGSSSQMKLPPVGTFTSTTPSETNTKELPKYSKISFPKQQAYQQPHYQFQNSQFQYPPSSNGYPLPPPQVAAPTTFHFHQYRPPQPYSSPGQNGMVHVHQTPRAQPQVQAHPTSYQTPVPLPAPISSSYPHSHQSHHQQTPNLQHQAQTPQLPPPSTPSQSFSQPHGSFGSSPGFSPTKPKDSSPPRPSPAASHINPPIALSPTLVASTQGPSVPGKALSPLLHGASVPVEKSADVKVVDGASNGSVDGSRVANMHVQAGAVPNGNGSSNGFGK